MGSTKHEKSFVDFEQPYEQNVIGLKGIFYFGIGLFLLIVITFALMAALLDVFEDDAKASKKSDNPMAMNEKERLPPEPRLQVAPGFEVDGPNGKVKLELGAPQAEYREMHKQWLEIWEHGQKDPHTGVVTSMSITEAKERFLSGQIKAKTGPEAEQAAAKSKMYFTDSSSGRRASEKRR